MVISSFLTSHELFKVFSREEVDFISNVSYEKRFRPGELIYRRRTPTSHFFLVLEGKVMLQLPATPASEEAQPITLIKEGELFGLSPVLGFDRYTVRALAETAVTLLAIEVKPFLSLLKANPRAKDSVVGAVGRSYYARYLAVLATLQEMMVGEQALAR